MEENERSGSLARPRCIAAKIGAARCDSHFTFQVSRRVRDAQAVYRVPGIPLARQNSTASEETEAINSFPVHAIKFVTLLHSPAFFYSHGDTNCEADEIKRASSTVV